jgi:cell cycle sensor histidine kinase DivJ
LSFLATRCDALARALASGSERLVLRDAACDESRPAQGRALRALIVGAMPASATAWLLLPAPLGLQTTFAVSIATFALAVSCIAVLSSTGLLRPVLGVAASGYALLVAALVAAAGGVSGPVALLALVLPIEGWMILRSKRAVAAGAAAGAAALALGAVLSAAVGHPAAPSAWHWLLPLAYAAVVASRFTVQSHGQTAADAQAGVPDEMLAGTMVIHLADDGDVRATSGRLDASIGLSADLLEGDGLFSRIHVADRVAFMCALSDVRSGAGGRSVDMRVRQPARDGGPSLYRPLRLDLTRSTAAAGGVVGLLRDNDEIATLRAEVEAARVAGEALELSKTRFLAAVSHELRTPLNSIIGFSDMLLADVYGPLPDDRQRESTRIVRDAGTHLLAVVNSILDVSKIEAGCYAVAAEPFALRKAVDLCVSMMQLQAEAKAVAVETRVAGDIGEVCADERAVRQILINLLSNAIKFTPQGGRVTVGAHRVGSHLHMWVSDTGIGIAEHDLAGLCQPFAQVQNDYTRQHDGAGLGLALVKGLVALQDGTMSLESTLGKGTTVKISLPAVSPAEPTRIGPPAPVPPRHEQAHAPLRKSA